MLPHEALRVCVIGPGRLGTTLVASLRQAGIAVPAVVASPAVPPDPAADPPRVPLPDAVARRRRRLDHRARRRYRGCGSRRRRGALQRAARAARRRHPLQRPRLARPARAAARHRRRHPLAAPAAELRRARRRTARCAACRWPSPATRRPTSSSAAGSPSASAADPFALADEAKPLYHLAAAAASNLFVALQSEAGELMAAAAGLGPAAAARLLEPLVATTAANIAAHGPVAGADRPGGARRRRHRARPP